MQKYHIGKNGPAPCRANPDKPGGRACRYRDALHGPKDEVEAAYEKQMEESGASLLVVSKKENSKEDEDLKESTRKALSSKELFEAPKDFLQKMDQKNQEIAMKLALTDLSPLAYIPVKKKINSFESEGISRTVKLQLEDGTKGYFKSYQDNANSPMVTNVMVEYGTTPLGCAINEVNAYRMAKIMGPEYEKLVPETVLREHDGEIGSFQKEVRSSKAGWNQLEKEDVHRAAVFDFAIGSLDRHHANYLTKKKGEKHFPILIDNSFSFHDESKGSPVNQTSFTSLDCHRKLTKEDLEALDRAEQTSEKWAKDGTISESQKECMKARINFLRNQGKVTDFDDYVVEELGIEQPGYDDDDDDEWESY